MRKLTPGLQEAILTQRLADDIARTGLQLDHRSLNPSEAGRLLARALSDLLARALDTVPERERPRAQVAIVNRLISTLDAELSALTRPGFIESGDQLYAELVEALREPSRPAPRRPQLPLGESGLYVNANRERRIGLALASEIDSADRIDLICAFLFWAGYSELRTPLLRHLEQGRSLRVLTTTYCGVTQQKVLDELVDRGARVKVSYNVQATRLHAKAWLFHRASAFSTAYVGSSNLSRAALTAGLEWNVRLSEVENRGVVGEIRATFDNYWEDPEFEDYEPDRFARQIAAERPADRLFSVFELKPRPFQKEILDKLQAERELHGRHKNLVVAATGTGKTVIAALDYRRLCTELGRRPTLLFVAHRREILRQSCDTFRHALSDPSFGERLVDGQRPADWDYVFASVQSLASLPVDRWADRYEVVIIDEFHHAEGSTYTRLLEHLQPKELLGLTATPERTDGAHILRWFDDRITAEVRLWHAIDRGLLVPFQYFAVHDNVPLDGMSWRHGRYDPTALDALYTGHHARAHQVVEAVRHHIYDSVGGMRALGFCAGVQHARFMAQAFCTAGIPSACVTSDTARIDRDRAVADLKSGSLRCIFSVDVFNEGVDIPEVDTVLFLRPTESAIVFLQQLGRGLRRIEGKRCLTVLDFVGRAHQSFRFDVRFRALIDQRRGRAQLLRDIEQDFPLLPAGCSIQLDSLSREIIFDNISQGIGANRRSLVRELRALGPCTLAHFLEQCDLAPADLYANGRSFTELRRAAGHPCAPAGPNEAALARGLGRVIHVDDRRRIAAWKQLLRTGVVEDDRQVALRLMLVTSLFDAEAAADPQQAIRDLRAHAALSDELDQLLDLLDVQLDHLTLPFGLKPHIPLQVHARYRLSEVMAAMGDVRKGRLYLPREGVYFDSRSHCNLLFVTLHKDEADYSASTLYKDYALGPKRFHWQSQSGTRPTDKKGLRHVHHTEHGITPLLFVRERRRDERGQSMAYMFLGSLKMADWSGERPMSVEWELEHEMPSEMLRVARVVA